MKSEPAQSSSGQRVITCLHCPTLFASVMSGFISQVERPLAVSLSATRTFPRPRTLRSVFASTMPS